MGCAAARDGDGDCCGAGFAFACGCCRCCCCCCGGKHLDGCELANGSKARRFGLSPLIVSSSSVQMRLTVESNFVALRSRVVARFWRDTCDDSFVTGANLWISPTVVSIFGLPSPRVRRVDDKISEICDKTIALVLADLLLTAQATERTFMTRDFP